jgi:hypothetical protein
MTVPDLTCEEMMVEDSCEDEVQVEVADTKLHEWLSSRHCWFIEWTGCCGVADLYVF